MTHFVVVILYSSFQLKLSTFFTRGYCLNVRLVHHFIQCADFYASMMCLRYSVNVLLKNHCYSGSLAGTLQFQSVLKSSFGPNGSHESTVQYSKAPPLRNCVVRNSGLILLDKVLLYKKIAWLIYAQFHFQWYTVVLDGLHS